jgi:hypothetical protein
LDCSAIRTRVPVESSSIFSARPLRRSSQSRCWPWNTMRWSWLDIRSDCPIVFPTRDGLDSRSAAKRSSIHAISKAAIPWEKSPANLPPHWNERFGGLPNSISGSTAAGRANHDRKSVLSRMRTDSRVERKFVSGATKPSLNAIERFTGSLLRVKQRPKLIQVRHLEHFPAVGLQACDPKLGVGTGV